MGRGSTFALVGALLLRHGLPANAAGLKVDRRDDILQSASNLAGDIAALYDADGENGPGRLSEDYYYWQSSAFMNTLIDYWHLTNDSTYNDIVVEGIVHQSTDDNFMPANLRPSYLGNDDQCFWGLAAMSAAEAELPDPDEDKPRWLGIAQGVYRAQKARLDAEDEDQCNGGLRWGVDESHHGYGWKNTLPNACLFDLSARLARHTGNASYADTALELWDWLQGVGLISANSKQVYLGADTAENCTAQSEIEDSLPASLLINGAAFMFNFTDGSKKWQGRVENLTESALETFFPSGVPFEPDCELHELCDVDTLPYKGVNIRALAVAAQVAPFTRVSILNTLKTTADAAVQGCTGGDTERQCSFYWYGTDYVEPETDGLMEQMNGLSAISSLLIETAAPPAIAPPEEEDDDEDSGDGDDDGESNGSNNGGGDDDDGDSENRSGEDSGDDEQGAGISSTGSISFCILLSGLLTSVWFGSVL